MFFLFKQKTSYEMRISDLSSDVCSSDLRACLAAASGQQHPGDEQHRQREQREPRQRQPGGHTDDDDQPEAEAAQESLDLVHVALPIDRPMHRRCSGAWRGPRSEEHTSELQSLMRISYAVFCLKKNKQTNQNN